MPHKVHALFDGVAMVNAVVAEIPRRLDVSRRQHRKFCDERVEATRIEQGVVRRVVSEHEEPADSQARKEPHRHDEPPRMDCDETVEQRGLGVDVAREEEQAACRGTLVKRRGNSANNVDQ